MASIYRQYENSNNSVLNNSIIRGEYIYALKLFNIGSKFTSEQGAVLRMRVNLSFMEAKAVVIDAYIQTEPQVSYMFVLCSSPLDEKNFSLIMRKYIPKVIVEKFFTSQAKDILDNFSDDVLLKKNIPIMNYMIKNNHTKEFLISILLEYKAMLSSKENSGLLCACLNKKKQEILHVKENLSKNSISSFDLEVIFFEKESKILCLPSFQILKIDKDVFQKRYIKILPEYGDLKIFVDEIFFSKKINLSNTIFKKQIVKGIFQVETKKNNSPINFNLMLPSLF